MKFEMFPYNLVKCLPHFPQRQNHMIDEFKKVATEPGKHRANLYYGFNLDYTLKTLQFNDHVLAMNQDRSKQAKYCSNLPGALGCSISFCACINIAKLTGFPYVFLFDDDITFAEGYNEKMEKALAELPEDFNLCLLGYFRDDFEQHSFSEHLFSADNIHNNGGFGILISRNCYDKILIDFAKNPMLLTDDFWYVNRYEKVYAVKERLVLSSPDPRMSTIEAREHQTENK